MEKKDNQDKQTSIQSSGEARQSEKQTTGEEKQEGKNPFGETVIYTDISLVEELQKDKQQLTEEMEALKGQYLRLAADFDNYRKRQSQEKEEMFRSGMFDAIKAFLPVLDSFDRAYLSFKTLDDVEKLKESFNVLYRQIQDGLAKLQVTKIKTVGETFDPNYHEGVMQEETDEYIDNAIMMELQCGYIMVDKVLRPSMVKVASNASKPEVKEEPSKD